MRLILLFPLLAIGALAQTAPGQPAGAQPAGTRSAAGETNSAQPASTQTGGLTGPEFSTANMDMTANPCVDFYQYACGTWMAKNPIPPDQSRWGTFDQLQDHDRAVLRGILAKASADSPNRSSVEQKIGDFYYSCMDEPVIDRLGIKPLEPELKRIEAIKSKGEMLPELVRLHLVGVGALFSFSSSPDAKNSTQVIAVADQGGLGLPDRDYYLKDDPKSVKLREQYVAHVEKMLELAGESSTQAAADAQAILRIETNLAKGSLDRVARRDPNQTYHKMPVKDLTALAPDIDWPKYFSDLGTPHFTDLNVVAPDFFKTLAATLNSTNIADLKTYLRWHLLHSEAPLLAKPFLDENFHYYGQILTGAMELEPSWKRCVEATDDDLGFALGQQYVEQAFPPDAKARVLSIVEEIEKMLGDDIQSLSWMTPATKEQALIKLRAVTNKIGYPDHWRDYSSVKIARGQAVGNDQRATEFEVRRELNKIGKPVDPTEWNMTPPTVNAYYSPLHNSINFPAGILQPPFYDNRMDAAVNYGAAGSVMGHELTHGFDDQGRQFDAKGDLRNWWTPEDAKAFEERAECFIKEYSAFTPVDDVHLNGKLTLGENTADNGGVHLAFMALMKTLDRKPEPKIDGFTPQQRFFLGYAQVWCQNVRPEAARMRAEIDPHSPGRDRVNGVVGNMPEFRDAFACH
ncbi:MAG: M13 family metallopeptidase, partial [Bryobacterales bacterium]|nr:M13 family metallopeptidase [Bryobacterales bacterium]